MNETTQPDPQATRRYTVFINYIASSAIEVEADSAEAVLEAAYEQAPGGLCHHCAANYTLGDPFGEQVHDEAGEPVTTAEEET